MEAQIRELNRMLQGGTPALVGADEGPALPDSVFRLLKTSCATCRWGERSC